MKVPSIELANISKYRGEQMGLAMLFIILFHTALPRNDMFFGLHRCGNVGVDIFLFLSGVGLWFSWMKTPHLKRFYWRRFIRIYPAWLIIACLYYIPRFSGDWVDLIGELTINWDFWRYDELTFWYIPAIMALYLLAPPYMMLLRKHPIYRWLPVLMVLWCILVQWVPPIHHAVGHLEIFWSRVPIFFIGINFGEMVKEKKEIDGAGIWMLILAFVMSFGSTLYLEQMTHGKFPLYVERMIYIPFTISTILMLNRVLRRMPQWFNAFWRFFGTISLEAYLLHLHFVMTYIKPYHLGYWPTALLTILVTIPLAWILHKCIEWGISRLSHQETTHPTRP